MVLRRRTPFLILLGALFALIGVTTHHSPVSGAGATTTAFDTLGPIRLVDTPPAVPRCRQPTRRSSSRCAR
ncbi:MAG: hypothetical protein R2713_13755 [Ilumatobacteraceae bacterium]